MAHSVAEAAARAVKNSQKKIAETRTPEQRLADIRKNRAAKLFVTPEDQDFLLSLYDSSQAAVAHLAGATAGLLARAEAAEAEVVSLKEKLEEFRRVYELENRTMAVKMEWVTSEAATDNAPNY